MSTSDGDDLSFLGGIRVLEIADELGEYCGKLLAGLGADVVKIEPPDGEVTRTYGPFVDDDPHPDRSLHFWHYNVGKRSVVLDLTTEAGRDGFRQLARTADVVIDSRPRGYLDGLGLGYDALAADNPGLVYARISPFGDEGPWADHVASDLVHLALGGVMMNCGYDAMPDGTYDTPPIAPQMWHAYHITGEMTAIAVIGALNHRIAGGPGQQLSASVHDATSKNTETDLPDWTYLRLPHVRQTCRHSMPEGNAPSLAMTKDGRWLLPYRTYLPGFVDVWSGSIKMLQDHGMAADIAEPRYQEEEVRNSVAGRMHMADLTDKMIARYHYSADLWQRAQSYGLPWAPLRRPEENVTEEHWRRRDTFFEVEHPELDATYTYIGAKWYCPEVPWRRGPRPPLLGEHTAEVLAEGPRPVIEPVDVRPTPVVISRRGKPFPLAGVRIVDLSWLLASAGSGRFFSAMGAEVIKVEHSSRWDAMRWGTGMVPLGGRAERDAATEPLPTPSKEATNNSPNRGGAFMEFNAGKLGISLNLKTERGKELLTELIRDADIVVEGYSPGTLDRMGFGYDRLREINPNIVYVQQSGLGQHGTYGALRSYGPTAQAFSGISEMSGLPEPYPPAGIGYSYLDWFGAYNVATAMLAGLYRRRRTGKGCHIDASQVETGLYLTGTAVLDHSVNGRSWHRYGNRSPFKPAAPSGAYRTRGADRWIAISCFTDEQWAGLVRVLGTPSWTEDDRFATLAGRLEHQDDLDKLLGAETEPFDGFALMADLQQAGVPAGVCQTTQDRFEDDPQLAHDGWLVELDQEEIGTWPVKEIPVTWSATPPYIGGIRDRSGPSYGQDNAYVYQEILGLTEAEIARLEQEGVI